MNTINLKTIFSYFVMIIFAGCIFSSCNDNDELIEEKTNQTEIVKKTKFEIEVDEWVRDANGNLWHIQGKAILDFSLFAKEKVKVVSWDVTLTNHTTGKSYHFRGISQHTNGKPTSMEGSLYDEKDNEIDLYKEIPNIVYIIDECYKNCMK